MPPPAQKRVRTCLTERAAYADDGSGDLDGVPISEYPEYFTEWLQDLFNLPVDATDAARFCEADFQAKWCELAEARQIADASEGVRAYRAALEERVESSAQDLLRAIQTFRNLSRVVVIVPAKAAVTVEWWRSNTRGDRTARRVLRGWAATGAYRWAESIFRRWGVRGPGKSTESLHFVKTDGARKVELVLLPPVSAKEALQTLQWSSVTEYKAHNRDAKQHLARRDWDAARASYAQSLHPCEDGLRLLKAQAALKIAVDYDEAGLYEQALEVADDFFGVKTTADNVARAAAVRLTELKDAIELGVAKIEKIPEYFGEPQQQMRGLAIRWGLSNRLVRGAS